jgi:predicted DNA-binding ribbon-helix-helix protein
MNASPARVVKRSLRIAGHATSISLEEPFWRLLRQIAEKRATSIAALVGDIDRERQGSNLSSAIRVHILEWMMDQSTLALKENGGQPGPGSPPRNR